MASGKQSNLLYSLVVLSIVHNAASVSYPLNHKGLLPAGKKLGSSIQSLQDSSSSKSLLKVSKNLFKKLQMNQAQLELEADREAATAEGLPLPNEFANPPRKFPLTHGKSSINSTKASFKKLGKYSPSYDCSHNINENPADGSAIIKPDPFDCGCCYYCNWGVHYVQCCTWPLLWNDDIKSCDWYWKVFCYTNDYYWKEK